MTQQLCSPGGTLCILFLSSAVPRDCKRRFDDLMSADDHEKESKGGKALSACLPCSGVGALDIGLRLVSRDDGTNGLIQPGYTQGTKARILRDTFRQALA